MPIIPTDQKFHTVPAGVDTNDRGSARANADREIYTMQDIADSVGGGGNVILTAKLGSNITTSSRLQYVSGNIDATTGLPIVTGNNSGPKINGDTAVGVAISGSSGDIVDLAVHGTFDNVRFAVAVGTTPSITELLYFGTGSVPYSGLLTTFRGEENFSGGRVVSTPTLIQSYPGFYDIYEATVFVDMPWIGAYYRDQTLYNDSQRLYIKSETGTVEVGEIVKLNSTNTVSRWDVSSGDTVNQIAGVVTTGYESGNTASSVCTRGLAGIPVTDVIGGATASVGDIIYSDATNSYDLTTDPTSGIQIGIVVEIYNLPGPISALRIDINPVKGGSTTGEDLSLNVRSAPYSATGDHEGTVLSIGTLGLTAGTVYMWDSSGEWGTANATTTATATGLMGIATATATAPDVLTDGIIQLASVPGATGDPLYLDTTTGLLTATAPAAIGNVVRILGYNLGGNRIRFNGSNSWEVV